MSVTDVTGDLPRIINNEDDVYSGHLRYYFHLLFCQMRYGNEYHNFGHICHVLWFCYECLLETTTEEIPPRQARNLLIAAIFHDFGHSGQCGNDKKEIGRAIRKLRKYIQDHDRLSLAQIESLIKSTQFPYEDDESNLSIEAKILRDADQSQCFSPIWIQRVIFGLAKEKGLSPKEMLLEQEQFLRDVRFRTRWAKKKFPPRVIEAKLDEVRALCQLLGMPR